MAGEEAPATPLETDRGAATLLLDRVNQGDQAAASELLPMVYSQLRAMAGGFLQDQAANHTLQPTALVHEVYLKLIRADGNLKNRPHFCAVAASAMRQILIDHARQKRAAKRAGKRADLTIDGLVTPSGSNVLDLLALNDALTKLSEFNERHARMVELRFLGGLTVEEVAEVMGITSRTIERDWRRVRAWLKRELGGESSE